ncbi:hypothetical protein GH714_034911 [Hevea brasiliensis]|uniref:Reverse transcriptase Ty1/copia-type domain-containing protein n=1 Tax=Hevea brasiliensis TaxID=3981 RepID=A0A6A6NCC8_HEVBR|nr:hypothetical protein GH714_034911 [Hevea brasiliensis]
MKDLGAAKKILGMKIIRDRSVGKLFLSQQAYVEKVLKRFNMNNATLVTIPFAAHFKQRYLKGITDVGLTFDRAKMSDSVIGYVDSDFAGDLDKRRSLTSYLFTLSGSSISWKAILQATVALSTTEAKYMALVEVVNKVL